MEIGKIKYLAELSKLKFSEEELVSFSAEIDSLIELADIVKNADIEKCVLVVGHKQEQVRETMGDSVLYAVQSEQLGTGHAVMQAIPELESAEKVVVLCGDAPLLSSETLKEALKINEERKEYATIFTAEFEDPTGYGRIKKACFGFCSNLFMNCMESENPQVAFAQKMLQFVVIYGCIILAKMVQYIKRNGMFLRI